MALSNFTLHSVPNASDVAILDKRVASALETIRSHFRMTFLCLVIESAFGRRMRLFGLTVCPHRTYKESDTGDAFFSDCIFEGLDATPNSGENDKKG
jgi:hypothetical protein